MLYISSEKIIERLSLYRRVLSQLHDESATVVFSHQLAAPADVTPAQVRRDIMQLGCSGIPHAGYKIAHLLTAIEDVLDAPESQRAVLVGVGHLGLALLNYFSERWRKLRIHAAFDVDPSKGNTIIRGCPCYPFEELYARVRAWNIGIGILTVPADQAQAVADIVCKAGVTGLLNFAPVRLTAPDGVYVENVDLTTSFEKVAYYARHPAEFKHIKESQ